MPMYNSRLTERARELRQNMTPQEKRLWYGFLRNHPLKFYRQRPIGGYIADFYCRKLRLVIEVDGSQHNTDEATEYDMIRNEYMKSLGLSVIRFSNIEIDCNFSAICEKINVMTKSIKEE